MLNILFWLFWLYACMAIQNICNQELLSRSLLTLSWSVCASLFVYLYSSVFENVFPCFCICISLFVCLYFAVCVLGISLFLNLHSLFYNLYFPVCVSVFPWISYQHFFCPDPSWPCQWGVPADGEQVKEESRIRAKRAKNWRIWTKDTDDHHH